MNKKTSLDDIVRENIKKIMKAKELRSIDIIRKTKYPMSTFYTYISGSRKISLKTLEIISQMLDVDYRILLDKNLIIRKINKVIIESKNV
jgi:predicted transcriptional regulator